MHGYIESLREEHASLRPQIDRLGAIADVVGYVPVDELGVALEEVYQFLMHQLVPHERAEDDVLYPLIDRLAGSPLATQGMRRDHREIRRLTEELATLRKRLAHLSLTFQDAKILRRALYGLHALTVSHLAKEEEFYLPFLEERLTLEEGGELRRAMEQAAQSAQLASLGLSVGADAGQPPVVAVG
ncbi:MAG: hemerythrin domain-containing protein [Chloroflexi bacterium]|nr:hemerythrin domain-containing protein [Chloroflexota bacterium]